MFLFSGKNKLGRRHTERSNTLTNDANKRKGDYDSDDEGELCVELPEETTMTTTFTTTTVEGYPSTTTTKKTPTTTATTTTTTEVDPLDFEKRLTNHVSNEMKLCFEMFDVGGSGVISFQQVKSALASYYIEADDEDCEAIIKSFDKTGTGTITFPDFKREMLDVVSGGTLESHIKMVYDMMDADGDGSIGVEEIKKQFRKLGISLSDEEAMENMAKIDTEGNGFIDYEMFRDFCNCKDMVQLLGKESLEQSKKVEEQPTQKGHHH